ncbi:MAG: hypothetical protein DRH17_03295 [Deltaproteobacteria bacterium]|nr:MAG: hypothetical protein DRH17_03295 [Deltaproteobacteria bacterium]
MAKKNKTDDTKKLIQDMTKEIHKVIDEDFNHEELRQAFVDFATFMFEAQVCMLDIWAEQKADFEKQAAKVFKRMKEVNDRDFKISERNFKKVGKRMDSFEHRVSKAEAMAAGSMLHMNAMKAALVVNSLLTKDSLQEGIRLIPKRVTTFLRKFVGMTPKQFNEVMIKAQESL